MFPGHVPLPNPVLKSVQEERFHDLKDFLGRPSVVDNGIITNLATRGTLVTQLVLPNDLLNLAMYREKTRGFLNFRATLNLRFQANAQRFQQGRLFIYYFPQATLNPKKAEIVYSSLTLSTQLPRVDFDFSTDSDVSLSIPYVSPTLGYNQVDGTGSMGTYQVRVYSPLVSPGGPATVDFTLWAWFTDVELDFPTFTPQAGIGRQAKRTVPSELEARPISTMFNKVAKAATIFTDVPMISSVAGSIAWVSNILGKTAASFGFSNPDVANHPTLSKLNLGHDIANVNAVSACTSLGLLSDNKVSELPGFAGTDIDEMSFAYLTKIPCYINNFGWTTSQPIGTLVYSTRCAMGAMSKRADSNLDMIYPTPMLYIANMFKYWRTGFTFTLKFVKTEFHSGRLMVVFTPGAATAPAFADTRYCYREVLDLRESNEFSITIPYTSTIPYRTMSEVGINDSSDDSFGIVSVYVLNPLVAPTTVSPSIDTIVEVCADDTFEVAVPRNIVFPPVMYTPGTGAPTLIEEPMEPQGLGESEQSESKGATIQLPVTSISGVRNNDGGIAAASHCIGEKILSLRSLAKRAAPILAPVGSTVITFAFRPKLISLDDCSDNVTVPADYGLDYISAIAPLYNYQRGGLKFFSYMFAGGTNVVEYNRAGLAPNTLGTAPVTTILAADAEKIKNNALAIQTGPAVAGGLSFVVPQYSQTHCEMYRLYTAATYTLPTDIYCSDLRVFIKTNVGGFSKKVLRQAADDWSCGFFTGCLPIRDVNRSESVLPAM